MNSRSVSLLLAIALSALSVQARAEQRNEIYWPRNSWTDNFMDFDPATSRLFHAFDYGHAILYENLFVSGGQDINLLEVTTFQDLMSRLIVATDPDTFWGSIFSPNPYRYNLDEDAIAPNYAKIAWPAMNLFDWTHLLHSRAYDILSNAKMSAAEKKAAMALEVRNYYAAPDLTFTRECKDMDLLMDGQYYSKEFRKLMPKFNALIWLYHWLQMHAYDALLMPTPEAQKQELLESLVRFARTTADIALPGPATPEFEAKRIELIRRFSFADDFKNGDLGPDKTVPLGYMPMTHASAPHFFQEYPEYAAIFDNLHMMHDVISDILVSDDVQGTDSKKREIRIAIDKFQDPKQYIVQCMGTAPAQEVKIEIHNGMFIPAMVHLFVNKTVKITLKSLDGAHGISIPKLSFKLEVKAGETASAELTPKEKGTFEFFDTQDPGTKGQIMVMGN